MATSRSSNYIIRTIELSLYFSLSSLFLFLKSDHKIPKIDSHWTNLLLRTNLCGGMEWCWPPKLGPHAHPQVRVGNGKSHTNHVTHFGGMVVGPKWKVRDCYQREEQWKKDRQKAQWSTTQPEPNSVGMGWVAIDDPEYSWVPRNPNSIHGAAHRARAASGFSDHTSQHCPSVSLNSVIISLRPCRNEKPFSGGEQLILLV